MSLFRRWWTAVAASVVAVVGLFGAGVNAGAAVAPSQSPTYPRTLAIVLGQDHLPGSTACNLPPGPQSPFDGGVLGRYDQVVIDMEWSNPTRRGCYLTDPFAAIRNSSSRGTRILAYVNPVDRPTQLGTKGYWAFRFDLWGCKNNMNFGQCNFPINWLAHTKKGKLYTEFNGTWMANLTDAPQAGTMPAGASSTTGPYANFSSYFSAWLGRQWNDPASGWPSLWDGVYLDVWGNRIWNNTNPWDPYWGGSGDTKKDFATDTIYADPPGGSGPSTPSGLWQRGIADGNAAIHSTTGSCTPQGDPAIGCLPTLVANNTQSATTAPGENGRLWESFADPALGRQWSFDVPSYVDASGPNGGPLRYGSQTPTGTVNLQTVDGQFSQPGSLGTTDFRRARYDLGATLLGNGYWAAATPSYELPLYFDEMDGGAGIHQRGYLGLAVDPSPTYAKVSAPWGTNPGLGSYAAGTVFRRDFDNGIVLVNSTSTAKTVDLGTQKFHRLTCSRNAEGAHGDIAVDNGATVTGQVTIPGTDGLVLLDGPGGTPATACGS